MALFKEMAPLLTGDPRYAADVAMIVEDYELNLLPITQLPKKSGLAYKQERRKRNGKG